MSLSFLPSLQKQVCPYCFEPYGLRSAPFRCASPAVRCAPEVDAVRAKEWGDSAPIARVLSPEGASRQGCRCATCNQMTHKRICPKCHMDLPNTTGKFRNLIFAVVGAKEAGKSHYIAVLIERIRAQVGPSLDMLLEPLDDFTIKRYRQDFYAPIYQQGTVIRGTVSALADRRVQMPLVYSLTFTGKDLFGRRCIKGLVTLVFFDTAGEDLDDDASMNAVNRYIVSADGIILLLDPLQIEGVRTQLDGATPLPRRNTETNDILNRITRLISEKRSLQASMIPTPLAIAFSKFDAVEDLVDPQMQLNSSSRHQGGYDVADFNAVSSEMQSLLGLWGETTVAAQAKSRYRHFGFFGLTALGCNPHGDQKIPRVLPRRVEDPFLWLLHCHGLIPAARRS